VRVYVRKSAGKERGGDRGKTSGCKLKNRWTCRGVGTGKGGKRSRGQTLAETERRKHVQRRGREKKRR